MCSEYIGNKQPARNCIAITVKIIVIIVIIIVINRIIIIIIVFTRKTCVIRVHHMSKPHRKTTSGSARSLRVEIIGVGMRWRRRPFVN